MSQQFTAATYHSICDELAFKDEHLAEIIKKHGYPPIWSRPNIFETLVHIILEQQVSLASALSALNKLKERIIDITPANLLILTDEELKTCYFSRQKTLYIKNLAQVMESGQLNLDDLLSLNDDEVKEKLTALKGIL